jgi:hypothetical protein
LLVSNNEQNRKIFRANVAHPLFPDLHNILMKYTGFDQIIDKIVYKLGGIACAYIIGDLAKGKDAKEIDLVLMGNEIDTAFLNRLIEKVEKIINRTITCLILEREEENLFLAQHPEALVIWNSLS